MKIRSVAHSNMKKLTDQCRYLNCNAILLSHNSLNKIKGSNIWRCTAYKDSVYGMCEEIYLLIGDFEIGHAFKIVSDEEVLHG